MKKVIFINFISVLIILILLEFIANFFKLADVLGIDYNLLEMDKKVPHYFTYKKNSEGIVHGKLAYIDENGFRIPNNFSGFDKNDSIIFFGDSVTFGNGVDEKNSFVGKIREQNKDLNIYNISLPGYGTFHYSKNLKYLKKFKNIQQLFLIYCLNDAWLTSNIRVIKNADDISFFDKIKKNIIINKVNLYLRNKSYLYLYIKGVTTDPSKRWFLADKALYNKNNILENIKNDFSEILDVSNKNKIKTTIILLPYEYQTRSGKCNQTNLEPQNKVIKILTELNANYKDYTNQFCNFKNPKKLFKKFDPMHLSEIGHNLVYENLKDEI